MAAYAAPGEIVTVDQLLEPGDLLEVLLHGL